MLWLQDEILAGRALRERQYRIDWMVAWYVNVQGSVHWERMHSKGDCTLEVQI